MLSKFIIRFQNCYKSVILNLFDYTNWTGDDAVIFDKCVQSTKNEILMLDTTYGPYEIQIVGNAYKDQLENGVGCDIGGTVPFLLASSPFSNMVSSNLFSYALRQFNTGNKHLG